jgi:hypothetical protein
VVLRGSLRPGFGSVASSVLRVMHLGQNRVRRGSARRAWLPRRLCAAELAGAVRAGCACARLWRKGGQGGSTKQTQDNAAYAGRCGAAEAWPWRSGGGGTPAAVFCQPSGLRPKFLGEKGGTGLQGAHLGVAVDGFAAQGSRRRSPGGAHGWRSRRRSLQGLEWSAAAWGSSRRRGGAGALLGRGSGVAGRHGRGGAEARHGGGERRGG